MPTQTFHSLEAYFEANQHASVCVAWFSGGQEITNATINGDEFVMNQKGTMCPQIN